MLNSRTCNLRWIIAATVGMFVLMSSQTVSAGGWAVLTLSELPTQIVKDEPITVEFAVRQHGETLIDWLSPMVKAVHSTSDQTVSVNATMTEEIGYYSAVLLFPEAGQWRWSIDTAFQEYMMPPLSINDAPFAMPSPVEPVGEGATRVASGLIAVGMVGERPFL